MSYTALYRKFRPLGFEDVKGQEHIVKTLKHQIMANRVGHAYLFCGTRGTGKTTVAKILAKAVNCEHPVDGSPCNECEVCKAIQNQTSMNVIEIDAASNNGVDNIREIIEEVQYSPTEGKYKVYIIDEVHMLSAGAFNALLKTLEEPPSYVIFILATTEVHKIPITILSRCQRYDFHRITIDVIAKRMQELMKQENVEVEPKALQYVAKAADGSMRDGLSLLDQCIAFYFGETLTYDKVLEVLGAVDIEVFQSLLTKIMNQDVVQCIELIDELIINGRELNQFVIDFTWYLRNLMLVKTSDRANDMVDVSSEQRLALEEVANNISLDTLLRFIRIFSELSNQIKYSSQKRVLVEVACIKLCKPVMEKNYDSIIERLRVLEEKLEKGIVVSNNTQVAEQSKQENNMTEVERPKITMDALPEDLQLIAKSWSKIVMAIPEPLRAMIHHCIPTPGEGKMLILAVTDEMVKSYIDKPENMSKIKSALETELGKLVEVKTKLVGEQNETSSIPDLSKIIHVPNIEYVP